MAREATITQQEVNAVANRIGAGGGKPTARAVRLELGAGSMATVLRYLQVWKAGQVPPVEVAVTLPPALQRSLLEFVAREVEAARGALATEVMALQEANNDLIAESERQARELDGNEQQIEALRAELAGAHGRMAQLTTDLAANQEATETQREAVERARTEVALQGLRLEGLPKLEAEVARLQGGLESERSARVAAEQASAVAAARLEKSEVQVSDLRERLARTEADARAAKKERKTA